MRSRQAGFTLIELLVVIAIISLLSSIVLAALNTARDKGRMAAARQSSASIDHAAGDYAVGIWDFSECSGTTATDRSGNGNNGTLTNPPAWLPDVPLGTGCSLSFNGSTNYVTVPDSSSIDFGPNQDFSIAFWIKTTISPPSSKPLAKKNVDGVDVGWGFYQSGSNVFLKIGNGSTVLYEQSVGPMNDGLWHYVVFAVTRAGNCSKYLDGGPAGSSGCSSWAATDLSNANALTFGANLGGVSNWAGQLFGIHIFAKSLTASEVGKMYAAGKSRIEVAGR